MNAHRLTISHADTCLPDYWSGHHLAHVSIPVYAGMTPADIRAALHSEVSASAFAGNVAYTTLETDEWHAACHAAIDAMTFHSGDGATYFNHLEDDDGAGDSVYAYFVFINDDHESITE